MKALVLAAGESTRMRPLSSTRPKHLIPVANKPIIFHTIDNLIDAGINEIFIVAGYMDTMLKSKISEAYPNISFKYIYQKERKGTGHAVLVAESLKLDEPFFVVYGDILVPRGFYRDMLNHFNNLNYSTIIAVKRVPDGSQYGVLKTKNDQVLEIIEKPNKASNALINAGIYIFTPEIFSMLHEIGYSVRGELELTDAINIQIKRGKVGYFEISGFWLDVGRPWDLLDANKALLSTIKTKINGIVEDGAVLKDPVIVGEGTIIRSGAYIIGPVIIGKNADIGPNCFIRPYASIGDKVRIGNAVEIKNSIIMNGTHVGHLSYVGDSVIGENVNFGAGTITGNLRLDRGNIKATVKDKRIDTGRHKLGAIIGDNVSTGIGTLMMPGVMLYPNSAIGAGVVVYRDVPENKLILLKQEYEVHDWPKK